MFKISQTGFLQPPPPPPSDESYPPYPPSPPSSPTSSETPPPRTGTVDVCSIASQNPDSLLNQKCDKLPFLRENFEDRNPLSLLSRCCEQIEVLNSALCFCDERFQKVMNDNERKFRALFAAVPLNVEIPRECKYITAERVLRTTILVYQTVHLHHRGRRDRRELLLMCPLHPPPKILRTRIETIGRM